MKRLTIYRDGALEINCENCPETKICRSAELTESDCLYFLTERLAEYEDAEEQGLLVWLPCKVGDTVWFKTYKNGEYIGIKPHKVEAFRVLARLERGYAEPTTEVHDWEFGKTVFLTEEAAEKALEEV